MKHSAVLAADKISEDNPQNPIQLAQARAERIAKEKAQQQQQVAAAASATVRLVNPSKSIVAYFPI